LISKENQEGDEQTGSERYPFGRQTKLAGESGCYKRHYATCQPGRNHRLGVEKLIHSDSPWNRLLVEPSLTEREDPAPAAPVRRVNWFSESPESAESAPRDLLVRRSVSNPGDEDQELVLFECR